MWMIFSPHVIGCVVGNLKAKVIETESKMKNKESWEPGRELDALISEKVFGRTVIRISKEEALDLMALRSYQSASGRMEMIQTLLMGVDSETREPPPHYSTDIAAAWEVVEKLNPKEDEFRLVNFRGQGWECTFRFFRGDREEGETVPHSICLAALKAIGD